MLKQSVLSVLRFLDKWLPGADPDPHPKGPYAWRTPQQSNVEVGQHSQHSSNTSTPYRETVSFSLPPRIDGRPRVATSTGARPANRLARSPAPARRNTHDGVTFRAGLAEKPAPRRPIAHVPAPRARTFAVARPVPQHRGSKIPIRVTIPRTVNQFAFPSMEVDSPQTDDSDDGAFSPPSDDLFNDNDSGDEQSEEQSPPTSAQASPVVNDAQDLPVQWLASFLVEHVMLHDPNDELYDINAHELVHILTHLIFRHERHLHDTIILVAFHFIANVFRDPRTKLFFGWTPINNARALFALFIHFYAIASKSFDDFSGQTLMDLSRAGVYLYQIDRSRAKQLERLTLLLLDYNINISPMQWVGWLEHLTDLELKYATCDAMLEANAALHNLLQNTSARGAPITQRDVNELYLPEWVDTAFQDFFDSPVGPENAWEVITSPTYREAWARWFAARFPEEGSVSA